MRSLLKLIILAIFLFSLACGGDMRPATPLDTLKAYTFAIKKKDTTTMKLLLSDASMKMAEQQAREQNVTVDDIVKNETLFTEAQTKLQFRNEKIEGDRATIEVKNSYESWDVVPFVREDGVWKLDKQGIATQMQKQNDLDNKRLDDLINGNSQDGTFNPTMPQNPSVNPNNSQDPMVNPTKPQFDGKINPNLSPSVEPNQSVQP